MNEGKYSTMIKMFFEIFVILMIATAVMLAYSSVKAKAENEKLYIMCHAKSEVNGREKPNKHSSINRRFFPYDEIEVDYDSAGHGWCHVTNALNESGETWVKSIYVVRGPIETYPYGAAAHVDAAGRVAVRIAPSKSSERVKWIHPGDNVTVYAVSPDWTDIGCGYVMTQYLQEGTEGK